MTYQDAKNEAMNTLQKDSYFDYDMQDIWENIIDRIFDDGDNDGTEELPLNDAIECINEEMTYTEDQWTAYKYYCEMGDSKDIMWEHLLDDIYFLVEVILNLKDGD